MRHEYYTMGVCPTKVAFDLDGDVVRNIVFTGRVAPNKCQHDVIAAFALYQRHFDPEAKLFIVGSNSPRDLYFRRLEDYAAQLGARNVTFTGHVSFAQILAYYRIADLFLCMSGHEGFCVPLVEAMYFGLPIIACDAGAVADTLGGAGLLIREKDPLITAELMDRVMKDEALQAEMAAGRKEQLERFSYERVKEQFLRQLGLYIG